MKLSTFLPSKMTILATVSCLAFLLVNWANAQTIYENKNWKTDKYKTAAGFDSCALSSLGFNPSLSYRSEFSGKGPFTSGDRGWGALRIYTNENLSADGFENIYVAKVSIDKRYRKNTRGIWVKNKEKDGGVLFFNLENYVDEVIKPLASGRKLIVELRSARAELKGTKISIDLKNSRPALIAFEKCLSDIDVNSSAQ